MAFNSDSFDFSVIIYILNRVTIYISIWTYRIINFRFCINYAPSNVVSIVSIVVLIICLAMQISYKE